MTGAFNHRANNNNNRGGVVVYSVCACGCLHLRYVVCVCWDWAGHIRGVQNVVRKCVSSGIKIAQSQMSRCQSYDRSLVVNKGMYGHTHTHTQFLLLN